MIDTKKVNAAVKIKLSWKRNVEKQGKLVEDLVRLRRSMTVEELNEYIKRTCQ